MMLLTGATGFVGSRLVKELAKFDKVKCFILKEEEHEFLKHLKNVEIIYGNLLDKNSIYPAMKGIKEVVHLAAVVGSDNSKLTYEVNYRGTKNLVEVMKEHKVKKLIAMSSVAADFIHLGAYGKSKRKVENLLFSSNLNFIIVKPTLIYGKEGLEFKKISTFIKKFPILPIVGNGKSKKQPVYVDDIVSLLVEIIKQNKFNRKVYNAGGPDILSFNKFIDIIYSHLKDKSSKKLKIHLPIKICFMLAFLFKALKHPPISRDQVLAANQDAIVNNIETIKELDFNPRNLIEGLKLSF